MSIEAQPQAHNLFSFQIDWIKDKLDEIDANESPLAPKLRGDLALSFLSNKRKKNIHHSNKKQNKTLTRMRMGAETWRRTEMSTWTLKGR